MAVVLSHMHFCGACNEFWTCFDWLCPQDDCDELLCKLCGQRETQVAVAARPAITRSGDGGIMEFPRIENHPSVSESAKTAVPILAGECDSRIQGATKCWI